MATQSIQYASTADIVCDVSSLATSSTFQGGYESTQQDNTSNLYTDALVEGIITTGTSPTLGASIRVYAWGATVSLATVAKDTLDGTASAETLTVADPDFLRQIASITITATSNITYAFGPINLAQYFGGVMPNYWGLFVTHNTGVNLNATAGNHDFKFTGIKHTIA